MSDDKRSKIDLPLKATPEYLASATDKGFQHMVLDSGERVHIEHMCKENPNLRSFTMHKIVQEHGPRATMCLLENEGVRGKIADDVLTAIAMKWKKHLGVVELYNKYVEEFFNVNA